MAGIGELLNAHHGRLEALLDDALSAARSGEWGAYLAHFRALRGSLLEHLAYEDAELFPEMARTLGNEAEVDALREQHAYLRRQFELLSAAAPEHDPDGCLIEIEELAALVRKHHDDELHVCYPAADRLLSPGLTESAIGMTARAAAAEAQALDLRGLQPPEPMVRIFEALERSAGAPLRAILPHEPLPLYALLRERGFSCSGRSLADGGFEVLIERM